MYVPIVPGCQAPIIGEWPEYIGTECYVLGFCAKGSDQKFQGEPIKMYRDAWGVVATDGHIIDVGQHALMRIDGSTTPGELAQSDRSRTTQPTES